MPHQTWIADACRRAGLKVHEVPGWRTRGSSTFSPKVVICHHTAGPARGDMPSLNVLINGRSGLPGPLCQVGLSRSGTVYVVAAGRANHAGTGSWRGVSGNTSALGIEAESTGRGDWTDEQRRVYPILAGVLAKGAGIRSAEMICAHREWAPSRKIDPTGIHMPDLRARAAKWMSGDHQQPATPSTPISVLQEDHMPAVATRRPVDFEGHPTYDLSWVTGNDYREGRIKAVSAIVVRGLDPHAKGRVRVFEPDRIREVALTPVVTAFPASGVHGFRAVVSLDNVPLHVEAHTRWVEA